MKQITIEEQIGSNAISITGNSVDLYDSSNGIILNGFSGFEYPEVKAVISNVSGLIGASYVASGYGKRVMTIQGELVGTFADNLAKRQEILKVFRQYGAMKLVKFTTYDDLQLQCLAEVTRVTFPYTHSIQKFLIQLEAPDWRFYSQAVNEQEILPGETITLTNAGTDVTSPVYEVYGGGTNIDVFNLDNNDRSLIDDPTTVGVVFTLDSAARTILKDGVNSYNSLRDGRFINLVSGSNRIRYTVTSPDATSKVEFRWRDAYIGI